MIQYRLTGHTAVEIAASIESAVHAGQFGAGALLPPVRELAASLKVSTTTIASAYRLLQARGLVVGDRRRGTRVRSHVDLHRVATRPRAADSTLLDLSSGNPDPQLLPSLSAAWRTLADEPSLYGEPAEDRGLVTFAKADFAADGIRADELLVTSGALDAIERVLREHVRAGDRVLIEDPCYPALQDLVTAYGCAVEPIPVDAHGPIPDGLERALARKASALIVTPRAQNPTGAAMTADRVRDLQAVLKRERDALLIENDPLGPVAGARFMTLTTGRRRWAVVRSTSKFLGPDLRVAILAADITTLARVRGRQAIGVRWVSHVLQRLALALWSDPASGRLLARAAETYESRRVAFTQALAEEGVRITAASGFNVWIPVRQETAVVQRLSQSGWGVPPGERFRLRSEPGIRVTTSALEPNDSKRFARDLAMALRAAPPVVA